MLLDNLFEYGHFTVDQLMFAAINVRVFAKQTSLLLLMFADSCHADSGPCVYATNFCVLLMFANLLKSRNSRTLIAREHFLIYSI